MNIKDFETIHGLDSDLFFDHNDEDDDKIILDPLTIYLSDTWYWATADGEDVPLNEYRLVRELFVEYGKAGLMYYVFNKRGHHSEFSDINAMAEGVEKMESAKNEWSTKRKEPPSAIWDIYSKEENR